MKKILMFKLKDVCYDSYLYFCDSIASMLQDLGYNVEIFDGTREPLSALERYEHTCYDAVIDFNSDLPKILLEDGNYFLNSIQAPFYDIILDHPLYHHDMLKAPLHNFHVICLDRNHQDYIRTYYPHIQSVHVLPMTGEAVESPCHSAASIPILFCGSYTSSAQIMNAMDDCPHFMQEYMHEFIDNMLSDSTLTLEKCAACAAQGNETMRETFALHMQSFFLADSYLRAYRRELLLDTIIQAKLPLTLCGHGWANYIARVQAQGHSSCKRVQVLPPVSFADSFHVMHQAQITLNILPEFKNGSHDRIYSAMLNHSVCVTDSSPMLQEQFVDGQDLIFYSFDHITDLPLQLEALLWDNPLRSLIAENGYHKAMANHTWQARVKELLRILAI